MTEKMTYVKALEFAMSQMDRQEVDSVIFEKLEALKAQLEKRASYKGSGKPTKAQREAAEFREMVLETLYTFEGAVQCGEVAKALGESGQKVSAALRILGQEGKVVKTVGAKKVSLFAPAESVVAEEVEEEEG